ncbi:Uncharacterised protein [Clostridium sporogenes]|nr:Uncharacterised protein [Clostridium sporogenes]STC75613.1 Uncharacterised protein [Clostridium botulinum]
MMLKKEGVINSKYIKIKKDCADFKYNNLIKN